MAEVSIDLNADVGEGCPTDRSLLQLVTSASVACGFHAGDPLLMIDTARHAALHRVVLGAHPSYPDREGFGRRDMDLDRQDLVASIVYQIGAMAAAAASAGTTIRFVKPHGALYTRAARDQDVAEAVVEAMLLLGGSEPLTPRRPATSGSDGEPSSSLSLLCPAGSKLASTAARAGVPVYREAFVDRAYASDASLMPRAADNAVLRDPAAVVAQARSLALEGRVRCSDGSEIEVTADSLCLHGDTPGALELAAAVRRGLEEAGVEIEAFVPAPVQPAPQTG